MHRNEGTMLNSPFSHPKAECLERDDPCSSNIGVFHRPSPSGEVNVLLAALPCHQQKAAVEQSGRLPLAAIDAQKVPTGEKKYCIESETAGSSAGGRHYPRHGVVPHHGWARKNLNPCSELVHQFISTARCI